MPKDEAEEEFFKLNQYQNCETMGETKDIKYNTITLNDEKDNFFVEKDNGKYNDNANLQYFLSINDLEFLLEKTIIKIDNSKDLKMKKTALIFVLFYLIVYFFCCCSLLIANFKHSVVIGNNYFYYFHMVNFSGSFSFAIIQTFIFNISKIIEVGDTLYILISLNIGTTLLPIILFSFNSEFWILVCHRIEFCALIFLTLSNLLFIFHKFRFTENTLFKYRYCLAVLVVVLSITAVSRLFDFGLIEELGMRLQLRTHFFEFIGEMINGLFAFIFTLFMYKEYESSIKHLFSYDLEISQNCN